MTRAKTKLNIHLNGNYLDSISSEYLIRLESTETFLAPEQLVMQLSHKDVWLDYFLNKQYLISQLTSGDQLKLNGHKCVTLNGKSVLKFSKQFINTIDTRRQSGYELKSVKVNFILHWQKEGAEEEVKIILPEVFFEKNQQTEITESSMPQQGI
jgi:ATP-dependent DNA helicase RecQ